MPSVPGSTRVEIPDTPDAPPGIRRLYDDIREVTGVPLVNQLFRRLAGTPDLLPRVWAVLRPGFASGTVDALSAALIEAVGGDIATIPARPLDDIGPGTDRAGAIALSQVYLRNNARNLIAFEALFRTGATPGGATPSVGRATAEARGFGTLPPLPQRGSLPASAEASIARLNRLGEDGEPVHEASFWRHLGSWPAILEAVERRLADLGEGADFAAFTRAASARGKAVAQHLAVSPLPRAARDATDRIVGGLVRVTIPKMIPLGMIVLRDLSASEKEDARP